MHFLRTSEDFGALHTLNAGLKSRGFSMTDIYCKNCIDTSGLSRRDMLRRSGYGLGAMFLGSLLGTSALGGEGKGARKPDFKGTTQRVIHIFAGGAPSHLDTF